MPVATGLYLRRTHPEFNQNFLFTIHRYAFTLKLNQQILFGDGGVLLKNIFILTGILFLAAGCDNVTVEGPQVAVKYHFSSQKEFTDHYLPLQDDHGGIKSWVPSEDMDCRGGKVFTLADGHEATFCPANGDENLFK